jgi:hypothetical protein
MLKNYKAQGELSVIPVTADKIPGVSRTSPADKVLRDKDGSFIVGHSETGHHHVLDANAVDIMFADVKDNIESFFVRVRETTQLTHRRPTNTHAPVDLEAGQYYEIRGAREYDAVANANVRIRAD